LNDSEEDDKKLTRKSINLARLLSSLVSQFHLPISILKPLDMSNLSAYLILFLATFFIALFSEKVSLFCS
jgi:hypothetical protein